MTNPSYEYMRRIRREEQVKFLGLRRERAVKALSEMTPYGDSHTMLSQIAYAIHPQVGSWDEGACLHLRNVLIELIGGDHEVASDAQYVRACGVDGCDCGNESEEVDDGMVGGGRELRDSACGRMGYSDVHQEVVGSQYDVLGNERHKAVCGLRKLSDKWDDAFDWYHTLSQAIGLGINKISYANARDRLIHLLGGDLSHDTNPMRQEHETRITDKPDDDERYVLDTSKATTIGYEPDGLVVKNGEHEVRITNSDTIIDGISVVDALNEVANGRLPEFAKNRQDFIDYMQREIERLCDELEARKLCIDRMRDEIMELRKVRDELQGIIAELNEQLERRKAKCLHYKTHIGQMQGGSKRLRKEIAELQGKYDDLECERDEYRTAMNRAYGKFAKCHDECLTYREMLNDATRDYKALRDKLDLVLDVCKSTN